MKIRYLSKDMKKVVTIPFVVLYFGGPASGEDLNFICHTEMSTGFRYNEVAKKWQSTDFDTDNNYLLKPSGAAIGKIDGVDIHSYQIVKMGDDYPSYWCQAGFSYSVSGSNELSPNDMLFCSGFGQFNFNKKTLRYVSTYPYGWNDVQGSKKQDTGNTPSIELGSCAEL